MESLKNSAPFSELSCPRLLAQLHRSRFGGTVRVSRGALLKLLYFQAGEIAMASSNDQSDHLAPILIRAGKLKPEQLELARKQARPGTSLARVLVQMGFLTSGELFAGARQQLRQIVGSVLTMTDAAYELQPDYFPREITSLNVETRELLLDLIRELPDRSFVLLEIGAPDSIFQPAPAHAEESARLPRAWRAIAEQFTGPLTIHEVGQMAGLDDFAASKSVYALHLIGLLEPGRAAEAPAVSIPISVPVAPSGEPEALTEIEVEEEEIPVSLSEEADETSEAQEEPMDDRPAGIATPAAAGPFAAGAIAGPETAAAAASPALLSFPTPAERPAPERDPESEEGPSGVSIPFPTREEEPAPRAPIRMEFRGPVGASAARRRSGPWTALSVLSGVAILGFALYWFVFLKPAPAPSEAVEAPPRAGEEVAGTAPAPGESSPAQKGAPEPGGVDEARPATESAAASGPPAEPAPAPESAPTTNPPSPGDSGAAVEAPPPPAAVPPAAGPATAGFAAARTHLDAGRYPEAASGWAGWIARRPEPGFTLQLAIACRDESIRKAAEGTRGSDQFFVVPFSLKGKPCYRLCWGAYATLEAAQSARPQVPATFLSEGAAPVAVSFGRLVPAETR